MNRLKQFILSHRILTIAGALCLIVLIVALVLGLQMRKRVSVTEATEIFIPTGSTYDALVDSLMTHKVIEDPSAFNHVARTRSLSSCVKGGRYVVQPGMSFFRLVNKLRSGNQDALRLTINKHRTAEQLCQMLGTKLELQPDSLLALLCDSATAAHYGLTPQTMLCLFIPNTYDIYWTTTPQQLLDRMQKEYSRFWTPLRKGQCTTLGLSPEEVITLASIVEEETNQNDEKPLIASVYLNRLRKGMLLQADPTVKYAVGNFTLRRILHKHLAADSPYNTYLYPGLPPGPICLPSIKSIDAVLANFPSNYLYFCAKEDFSGHHNFAATPQQHLQNAQRFHQAMNQRGIR